MALDPSNMVFRFLLSDVVDTIQSWSGEAASQMATIVTPLAGMLFGIYLLFFFGGVARGSIQAPLPDFTNKALRGTIIIMFATAAGVYQHYVADTLWQIPAALAQEIAHPGSTTGLGGSGGNLAIAKMLDESLQKGLDAGFIAWDKMSGLKIMASVGYAILAVMIWIFVSLVCLYACSLVLISAIGLAVMLGLGPLFIVFAIFESTQQFFVAWTRQVVTFAIFFLVLSCVISVTFSFFTPFLQKLAEMSASQVVICFVMVICVCGASLLVLHQTQTWASGLAGGIALQTSGAIGRAVGGVSRAAMHTHYDPMKQNKDGTSGGHRFRGAIPSTVNAGRAIASRGFKYMRRNQIQKND